MYTYQYQSKHHHTPAGLFHCGECCKIIRRSLHSSQIWMRISGNTVPLFGPHEQLCKHASCHTNFYLPLNFNIITWWGMRSCTFFPRDKRCGWSSVSADLCYATADIARLLLVHVIMAMIKYYSSHTVSDIGCTGWEYNFSVILPFGLGGSLSILGTAYSSLDIQFLDWFFFLIFFPGWVPFFTTLKKVMAGECWALSSTRTLRSVPRWQPSMALLNGSRYDFDL